MIDAEQPREDEPTSTGESAPVAAPEHIAADELRSTAAQADPDLNPDLATLLAEFDAARPQQSAQPQPSPDGLYPWQQQQQGATPEAAQQAYAQFQRLQQFEQANFLREANATADKIFGDLKIAQEAKIAWLEGKARQLPQALNAWRNRNVNPQAWNAWEQRLSKEVESAFKPLAVDADATGDHNAVVAAVRSAGGDRDRSSPTPNWGRLSDRQLNEYTLENYGYVAVGR